MKSFLHGDIADVDGPRLGPSDLKDTDARAQVVGMPVLCPTGLWKAVSTTVSKVEICWTGEICENSDHDADEGFARC